MEVVPPESCRILYKDSLFDEFDFFRFVCLDINPLKPSGYYICQQV